MSCWCWNKEGREGQRDKGGARQNMREGGRASKRREQQDGQRWVQHLPVPHHLPCPTCWMSWQ